MLRFDVVVDVVDGDDNLGFGTGIGIGIGIGMSSHLFRRDMVGAESNVEKLLELELQISIWLRWRVESWAKQSLEPVWDIYPVLGLRDWCRLRAC